MAIYLVSLRSKKRVPGPPYFVNFCTGEKSPSYNHEREVIEIKKKSAKEAIEFAKGLALEKGMVLVSVVKFMVRFERCGSHEDDILGKKAFGRAQFEICPVCSTTLKIRDLA